MGSNNVTLAVISVTSTIAVSGARTMAVKIAAIPTKAKPAGSSAMPGKANAQSNPNQRPSSAPSATNGTSKPPGVPAATETAISPSRNKNSTGRRASVPTPFNACCAISSPPPTKAGANHAIAPTIAPMMAARHSAGRLGRRSVVFSAPSKVRL